MTWGEKDMGGGFGRPADHSPHGTGVHGSVELDRAFDIDELAALREAVAAQASARGATDRQVQNLIIVASELASNAIRHGGGAGRLRLWQRDGVQYCQVSDRGPGIADPTVGTVLPEPVQPGGRGMWIVRNLVDSLVIETGMDGRGAVVTASVRP